MKPLLQPWQLLLLVLAGWRVVKKHSRDITAVRIGSYMADPTSLSATTVDSDLILIWRNGTSDFC